VHTHSIRANSTLRSAALVLAVAASLFAGCGQVYDVRVDAMRTPEVAPRQTFLLVAADPARDAADPTFAQAIQLVERALETHGLVAASRAEWADMVIALDFGIGQRRLVTAPEASGRDAGIASVYLPDRSGDAVDATPGIQVPGTAFTRVVAVWEKHLSLVARENRSTSRLATASGAELWRVDVSVQDETPTLEELIPVLAAALIDSIDREDGRSATKRISAGAAHAVLVSGLH